MATIVLISNPDKTIYSTPDNRFTAEKRRSYDPKHKHYYAVKDSQGNGSSTAAYSIKEIKTTIAALISYNTPV